MYRIIEFEQEEEQINDFLSFPDQLYTADKSTQNKAEELALLKGTHFLSSYFSLRKFLVYDSSGKVSARCVTTIYPDNPALYLGFFEAIPDPQCSRLLFDHIADWAKKAGFKKIVGPVDCSFWIRYRLKVDQFDRKPYLSEPYNLSYYLELFEENQFETVERYVSNFYPVIPKQGLPDSYERIYKRLLKQGYTIVSPKKAEWGKAIDEVYQLIMELYADFPVFKPITQHDFRDYFANYKMILDFSMVKMVYYKNQPVAFFIGVPDYGNLLYKKMTPVNLIKLLLKKRHSRQYILPYLGVLKAHRGAGLGIAHEIMLELATRKASSVGAFIQKGKVTERYWQGHVKATANYVLLERRLSEGD